MKARKSHALVKRTPDRCRRLDWSHREYPPLASAFRRTVTQGGGCRLVELSPSVVQNPRRPAAPFHELPYAFAISRSNLWSRGKESNLLLAPLTIIESMTDMGARAGVTLPLESTYGHVFVQSARRLNGFEVLSGGRGSGLKGYLLPPGYISPTRAEDSCAAACWSTHTTSFIAPSRSYSRGSHLSANLPARLQQSCAK
jgi:hypothetical protein